MDLTPPQMPEHDRIVLERIKYQARQVLGPQVAHDLEIRRDVLPQMFDQMVFALRTQVYAHKLDHQDVAVPFERTETIKAPTAERRVPSSAWYALAGLMLCGAVFAWPPLGLLAVGVAVLAWLDRPRSVEAIEHTVHGEVVVHADFFNKFPDNSTVYPDSLGKPVQFIQLQPPEVRYWRDDGRD